MQLLKITEGKPCANPLAKAPGCNVKDGRYSRIQEATDPFFGHYFWTRPTIEWSLDCSSAQMRETIRDMKSFAYSLGYLEALINMREEVVD